MQNKNRAFLGLLLILLAAALFFDLKADAAADIDFITAHLSEEGFKIFSARNMAEFGRVMVHPDQVYAGWICQAPAPQFLYFIVLLVVGSSYAAARSVTAFLALAVVLLFSAVWKRRFSGNASLLGLLLALGSYPFIMYSRFIALDLQALFFLASATLLLFDRPLKRRDFGVGFLFGCALLCKQVAVVALPAFGLIYFLSLRKRFKRGLVRILSFVAAVTLVHLLQGIWASYWVHQEGVRVWDAPAAAFGGYALGGLEILYGLGRFWSNALEWSLSPVLTKMPVASFLAYLGILATAFRWAHRRVLREEEIFFGVWFFSVAAAATAVGFSQAPTRLMIYSVPAVWMLALTGVEAFDHQDGQVKNLSPRRAIAFLLICLICAYGIVSLGVYWTCAVFFGTIAAFGGPASIVNQIGALVLGLLLWGGLLRFGIPSSKWIKTGAVILIVLGTLFGGMLYGRWALTGRTHQTVAVSRELNAILPPRSKVQGSLQFMLENDHIWFSAVPRAADHRWISAADYFLFSHHDDAWADQIDPALREDSLTVIKEFRGGGERTFTLYRVDPAYRITPTEYHEGRNSNGG